MSTVMVVGGVGDYLAVADTVIAMTDWRADEVTEAARAIGGTVDISDEPLPRPPPRTPLREGLAPTGKGRIRARNDRAVDYGKTEIDLTAVEQVLDGVHAATIGRALALLHSQLVDGRRDLVQVLDALDAILDDEGPDALSDRSYPDGWLVRPRRFEVAAAWSRLRGMRVKE
jgi:predicted ABC-class ATPase